MGEKWIKTVRNGKKKDPVMQDAVHRLRLFEESIDELFKLSEEYPQEIKNRTQDDIKFLYKTLTEDICRKCPRYRHCYEEEQKETLHELSLLLNRAARIDRVDGELASKDFRNQCVFFQPMVEELKWLRRLLYQNHYWESRLAELRDVMRKQLAAQQLLMQDCRRQMTRTGVMERRKKTKIKNLLLRKGFYLSDAREYKDESDMLEISMALRPLGQRKAALAADCLSEIYGKTIRCSSPDIWLRKGTNYVTFVEESGFHVMFGKKHCSKGGEGVCGDTFSFANYNRKNAVMVLSDGMGAGEQAYQNSRKLLESFEAMMEAGIHEECAFEMLHNARFLQNTGEFSTLDVSVISMRTGMIKILKAGGAATFIRHRHSVERIASDSLPLGYLPKQRFEWKQKKLYDGDIIVMVSDGMLDFETMQGTPFTMETILSKIETQNAQTFAEQLMEAIPIPADGHDDDRTALVAAVWERGQTNAG